MRSSLATLFVYAVLMLVAVSHAFYVPSYISDDFAEFRPIKKSGQLRALAGGRNCYFSPINCVIPQDMAKYRKLGVSGNKR